MKLKDAMFYYNLEKVISSISKRQKMLSSNFNYEEFLEIELSDESDKFFVKLKFQASLQKIFYKKLK